MKIRNLIGLIFSSMFLLQVTGMGLAVTSQPAVLTNKPAVNASSATLSPWINIEVDTINDTGQHTSLAIDQSTSAIFISYYNATIQKLRYARSIGFACESNDNWGCQTLDSGADLGKYSSIAVDPSNGGVGIAYHDATNGKLKYIYFENPHLLNHTLNTIDQGIFPISSTGLHTSLKFMSMGHPVIMYNFENPSGVEALELAYYTVTNGNCEDGTVADTWRCHTISQGEGIGQYTSLALVDDWDWHIAYYNAGNGELWYASTIDIGDCFFYQDNDMLCYPISGGSADVGQYASMYVDNEDHFHIAYHDATNHKLKYAVDVGSGGNCGVLGSAQCDTIDDMSDEAHPLGISIAEDASGYPIIAYQSSFGSLNVARPLTALGLPGGSGNCGPENPFYTWYCETVNPYNPWVPARHGDYLSIAISPNGKAVIAYYGFITSSGGNLMVAYETFQVFMPLVTKN